MQILISDIRLDGKTHARAGLKAEVIADYTKAMKQGDIFPPIIVFKDGDDYWLADGFYRVYAALAAGQTEIEAEVRDGNRRDALLFAVGANSKHGLRR